MFCGSQALIKHSAGRVHIKPALCRSWSCDTCEPKRRSTVEMEIEAGAPDALVTLTRRRVPGASPEAARKDLGKWVPKFFRAVERMTGAPVEYYAVCEKHKSGWPHIHVAVRGWKFVNIKTLWALWRKITVDSDGVNVKRIPAKAIKKYLGKYLGKDLHKFGDSKRYWRTKNYLPPDWKKPSEEDFDRWEGWQLDRRHPGDVVAEYLRRGLYAIAGQDGETIMVPGPASMRSARGPP